MRAMSAALVLRLRRAMYSQVKWQSSATMTSQAAFPAPVTFRSRLSSYPVVRTVNPCLVSVSVIARIESPGISWQVAWIQALWAAMIILSSNMSGSGSPVRRSVG
jgi:hypothetical protein